MSEYVKVVTEREEAVRKDVLIVRGEIVKDEWRSVKSKSEGLKDKYITAKVRKKIRLDRRCKKNSMLF